MSHRPPRRRGRADASDTTDPPEVDARTLLGLLGALPDAVAVGFEPRVEHLDVHVRALPDDDRAAAAGLFTLVVPEAWTAVGAVVHGWSDDGPEHLGGRGTGHVELDDVDDVDDDPPDVEARVVVLRNGVIASELCMDGVTTSAVAEPPTGAAGAGTGGPGAPVAGESSDASPVAQVPEGLLVDSLHRMMGLPCPGAPPALDRLVLGLWSGELMRRAVGGDHLSWRDSVALHPGDPGPARVAPSIETLVEATARAALELDWGRMRRRAAAGEFRPADLDADEADWMDDTMFGRWILSAFPDPTLVVAVLRATGSGEAADGLEAIRLALPDV